MTIPPPHMSSHLGPMTNEDVQVVNFIIGKALMVLSGEIVHLNITGSSGEELFIFIYKQLEYHPHVISMTDFDC